MMPEYQTNSSTIYISLTKSSTICSRFSQASSGVYEACVGLSTVGAAQPFIHKISVKPTAGCRLYGIVISVQFHIRASFLFLRCKNEGKLLREDVKEVTIVCRLVGFDAVENKWIEY